MNLNNYKKFLETKLDISDDMLYRLRSIDGNKANHNLLYLNDYEVDMPKLDISFLDSDKEKDDMATFLPLDRADRVDMNDDDAPWNNKFRISGKWGRVARKVLNAAKEIPAEDHPDLFKDITDSDIEDYVNKFKSSKKRFDDFRLVHGEDIVYFYHFTNYSRGERGSLGESCMRYDEAQSYLNIYSMNPDKVRMLILIDTDSETDPAPVSHIEFKIKARALVWKLDNGKIFMDRIYTHDSSNEELFKEYAKDNDWLFKMKQSFNNSLNIASAKSVYNDTLACTLPHYQYEYYPYMDTLKYFNDSTGLFQSDTENMSNYRKLDETEGNANTIHDDVNGGRIDRDDAVYCEIGDGYTDRDTACYLDDEEVYAFPNRVFYSTYEGGYILKRHAVKSDYLNDHLRERNSIEVWNWHTNNIDHMPEDHDAVIEIRRSRDNDRETELRLKNDPNIREYGDNWYYKGIFNDIEVGDKVRINHHALALVGDSLPLHQVEYDPIQEYKVVDFVEVGGIEPYIDLGLTDNKGEEILFPVNSLIKVEKDPNQLELDLSYERFSHRYLNRYI